MRKIIVIGGGPAGVAAAIGARKHDPQSDVVLLSAEAVEPYEKPPLSKAVLLGEAEPGDAPIAGPGGLAAHGVRVRYGARCVSIDRTAREVVAGEERLPYDALVLATGALARELPALPPGMQGVHYLRTDADALALRRSLAGCADLVVIGAGLIGLEVAATAAAPGRRVTVLEFAPRAMMRALDAETACAVLAEHRRRGIEIRLGVSVIGATRGADGRLSVTTATGETYPADEVVVGVGVVPNVGIAAEAGLDIDDGILVDETCRTSDPQIFAAGDCTRFPGPGGHVRLENWRHALDQGAVAGRNAAGATETYGSLPSFWSEQYDLYIQGTGWPVESVTRISRRSGETGMVSLALRDSTIANAVAVNAARDIPAIRRLIERRVRVDPEALADPDVTFGEMLRAKPPLVGS